MDAVEWRRELCERIAADQWREMTPTLVRAWATPIPAWAQLGKERPERLAIASMYGDDKVVDALLDTMAAANPLTQTNLRSRCWQLIMLEGQESRLRELLADEAAARAMAARGRATILARHTCAHRVDQLLGIVAVVRPAAASAALPHAG